MPNWNQPSPPPPEEPGQQPPKGPGAKKIFGLSCLGVIVVAIGIIAAIVVIIVIISLTVSDDSSDDDTGSQQKTEEPKDKDTGTPKEAPADKEKTKRYGDGDYVVGEDIPAGTYESGGAKNEVVDLCTVTTEPKGDKLPQAKTADRGERLIITLTKGDGTVTIQGCEPLKPR
ncbi:hypothetical protein [Streptomyces boncukensis]|uniref:Uncharacterized protein n=1 Tax=Streptomyces boncukensis TaxID=2711219 RepID=A0A6G4WTK0_9ACTN|nr:hypothetical protein [Streptomyces boncukensis]NGO68535.1 hypothetical protein [Streptomyces boncukensis]